MDVSSSSVDRFGAEGFVDYSQLENSLSVLPTPLSPMRGVKTVGGALGSLLGVERLWTGVL